MKSGKHLFNLRSQAVTEKLEDPSQIGKTRREIAQIKTTLREREIESQKKETAGRRRVNDGAKAPWDENYANSNRRKKVERLG